VNAISDHSHHCQVLYGALVENYVYLVIGLLSPGRLYRARTLKTLVTTEVFSDMTLYNIIYKIYS